MQTDKFVQHTRKIQIILNSKQEPDSIPTNKIQYLLEYPTHSFTQKFTSESCGTLTYLNTTFLVITIHLTLRLQELQLQKSLKKRTISIPFNVICSHHMNLNVLLLYFL
jgi:hypothetical protein